MAKELLINVSEGEECRIALVEDGRLEELYIERTSSTSHVGNIYKGKVTNVEASIQAAFIDFGLGRNGFLHVSDLLPDYFGKKGEDVEEYVGKKMARRDRPPIQRCLRRGDEITVQVIKEGIGTKGPTLSSYLSVSGKMLVMMPGVSGRGVSRKIEDEQERRRLKQILDSLDPPEDCGFIIRTEAVGKGRADIERDLKYLARLWELMKKKRDSSNGPTELYTEGDLVTRTIRDVFNTDVDRLIVDSAEVADRVSDVIRLTSPKTKDKVEVHDSPIPLFHKYGIERDIELMYSRHVPLPSGGSLVIDSTEAVVAIDVNSGKFREHADAETTAFKTDMEAADEICRQLKLRDLGGVIICDFIDLRYERHRRELEERIVNNFKKDRAKTKVLRMSQFGIVEITRQRMRPSLKRSVYFDCPHCKGAGLVKTPESMSLDVMRRLAISMNDMKVFRVELAVCPDVAMYLNNKKRRMVADLEDRTKKQVVIKADLTLGLDEMKLNLFDNRDGMVLLPELSEVLTSHPHTSQLHTRPPGRPGVLPVGKQDLRRNGVGGKPPEARRNDRERELADDREAFEDEEREERGEPRRDKRDQRPQGGRPQDERAQRDDREPREDRAARDDRGGRDARPPRDDRNQRDDRGQRDERGQRNDRPQRDVQPRDDRDRSRDDRSRPVNRDDRGEDRGNRGAAPKGDGRDGRRDERPPRRDDQQSQNRQRDDRSGRPQRDDRDQRPGRPDGRRDDARSGPPKPVGRGDENRDNNRRPQDERDAARSVGDARPAQGPVGAGRPEAEGEGENGGRRRRRRRRGRGRGRNGEQGEPKPLTAFGDYPEENEQPAQASSEYADDDQETLDRGPVDEREGTDEDREVVPSMPQGRSNEDDWDDEEDDLVAEGSESGATDEMSDDDELGPAPEPIESEYEDDLAFEPEEQPDSESTQSAEVSDRQAERQEELESQPTVANADPEAPIEPEAVTAEVPAPAEEAVEQPLEEEKPRRRGGTKAKAPGAKAAGGKKAAAPKKAPAAKATAKRGGRKASSAKSASDAPKARIAEAVPTPLPRKRAADKHLVAESETEAETEASAITPPARRPRSYRDLDAIPDDYD